MLVENFLILTLFVVSLFQCLIRGILPYLYQNLVAFPIDFHVTQEFPDTQVENH